MRNKSSFKVETWFGTYDVFCTTEKYQRPNNLAIQLWEPEEGPFATLTVNLGRKLPENQAFVDTNNCPWAEQFIAQNELGVPVGDFGFSGYCAYPLYEFNLERMK